MSSDTPAPLFAHKSANRLCSHMCFAKSPVNVVGCTCLLDLSCVASSVFIRPVAAHVSAIRKTDNCRVNENPTSPDVKESHMFQLVSFSLSLSFGNWSFPSVISCFPSVERFQLHTLHHPRDDIILVFLEQPSPFCLSILRPRPTSSQQCPHTITSVVLPPHMFPCRFSCQIH